MRKWQSHWMSPLWSRHSFSVCFFFFPVELMTFTDHFSSSSFLKIAYWALYIWQSSCHTHHDIFTAPLQRGSSTVLTYSAEGLPVRLSGRVPLPMQETWFWSLGQEDPMEKKMATLYCILAWEVPGTEEPRGQPAVHGVAKELGTT